MTDYAQKVQAACDLVTPPLGLKVHQITHYEATTKTVVYDGKEEVQNHPSYTSVTLISLGPVKGEEFVTAGFAMTDERVDDVEKNGGDWTLRDSVVEEMRKLAGEFVLFLNQ